VLDGRALRGVAGERVGVVEIRLRVAEGERAEQTLVGPERERRRPEVDDGAAGAVADAEREVVVAADDAVAGPELAPGLESVRAEATGAGE
jgi:hypothetical protein